MYETTLHSSGGKQRVQMSDDQESENEALITCVAKALSQRLKPMAEVQELRTFSSCK